MNSTSLLITGLGEVVALQLLLIVAGCFVIRKYKRLCRDLKQALKRARQSAPTLGASAFTPSPMRPDSAEDEAGDSALLFLQRQAHQSHIRMRDQHDGASILGALASPWSLRKHYLKAEVEALSHEDEGAEGYWAVLERKLGALLAKLQAADQGADAGQWQQRVEMLRERLVHFKTVEADCRQAQQSLALSRQRVSKLEQLAATQQAAKGSADKIAALNHMMKRTGTSNYHSVSHSEGEPHDDGVDQLTHRIREQRQLIERLTKQLRSYELSEGSESDRLLTDQQVGDLTHKVSALENDLQASEHLVEQLSASVARLRAQAEEAADTHHLRLVKAHEDDDIRIIGTRTDASHDGGDYYRAQEEVERLNDIIARQKRAIENFSEELSALRLSALGSISKEELSEKAERVERLERLLGESQTCIGMLEREVNDLQSQLNSIELDVQQHMPADAVNDEGIERNLDAEIAAMEQMLSTTMKAYADQSHLTQLAMQGLNCNSFHELGRELLDCLADLGVDAAVHIKGEAEQVDVFDKKKVSVPERQQLKKIDPLTASRVSEVPAGFVVAFPNITCLVKSNLLADERCTELQDLTTSMLSLVSLFVEKIDSDVVISRQKKALDQLVRSAHKTVKDIDVQYKYQSSEASLAVDRFMKEVYMAVNSMDLREADRDIFMAMVSDCQERMALLFATGLTIDNTMQRLLETFEKRHG